jgi:hypothetical protein
MAFSDAPPTLSKKFARRDPMRHVPIIRSTTFHWALAVAGVFAMFVIALFGFIYWQTMCCGVSTAPTRSEVRRAWASA